MLQEKGIVHRIFTQNTDDLFIDCGLTDEQVIHAHGRTGNAVCAVCGEPSSTEAMMEHFASGKVLWCAMCTAKGEKGPVKPNVVFFNEGLPKVFH